MERKKLKTSNGIEKRIRVVELIDLAEWKKPFNTCLNVIPKEGN